MPIIKKPPPPKLVAAPPAPHAPAPLPPVVMESENTLAALLLAAESIQQNSRMIKSIPELIAAPVKKKNFVVTVERGRDGFIQRMRVTEE